MSVTCAASGQNRFELFVDTVRIANLTVSSPTASYAWNTARQRKKSQAQSCRDRLDWRQHDITGDDVIVNNPN